MSHWRKQTYPIFISLEWALKTETNAQSWQRQRSNKSCWHKLNGANPLKFYLLLCLLAPLFDPLLLFITNIALGVEALFLQHTILCPTMDTNTFVSGRIKRKLDLRVAGQIGTHVDFRKAAPFLHLNVTENTPAAVQEVLKCCLYLYALGGLQLLLRVHQTPLPTILALNGQSSVSCKLGRWIEGAPDIRFVNGNNEPLYIYNLSEELSILFNYYYKVKSKIVINGKANIVHGIL